MTGRSWPVVYGSHVYGEIDYRGVRYRGGQVRPGPLGVASRRNPIHLHLVVDATTQRFPPIFFKLISFRQRRANPLNPITSSRKPMSGLDCVHSGLSPWSGSHKPTTIDSRIWFCLCGETSYRINLLPIHPVRVSRQAPFGPARRQFAPRSPANWSLPAMARCIRGSSARPQ